MKERKLSSVVSQLNTLLLTANTLVCESGLMENAGKKYGFYYAVRYKDPETKKWIPSKKSTGTDDETTARAFAIENRDAIIQEYKERKEIRAKKDTGESFYRMLREYYTPESKYLLNDKVNNKRKLPFHVIAKT